jgi:hypothetical protein
LRRRDRRSHSRLNNGKVDKVGHHILHCFFKLTLCLFASVSLLLMIFRYAFLCAPKGFF